MATSWLSKARLSGGHQDLLPLMAALVPNSTAGLPQREAFGEGERAELGSEGSPRTPWSIS